MKKPLIVSFVASLTLFLATCWIGQSSIPIAGWTGSILYFLLTWFLLNTYTSGQSSIRGITTAVVVGRLAVEIPLRIVNFSALIFSILVPVIVVSAILLAALCFREKTRITLLLSAIVLILMNLFSEQVFNDIFPQWHEYEQRAKDQQQTSLQPDKQKYSQSTTIVKPSTL